MKIHTLKTLRAELAPLGITIKTTGYGNEILVRIKGSHKDEGAFCDHHDKQTLYSDVLATGKQMARTGATTLI